jgi:PIN domain nuclease of toxin-antitoxin system
MKRLAMRAIGDAIKSNGALVSAISAWEIGMLVAKGRLIIEGDGETYVRELFSRQGILEEPVTAAIAEFSSRLPGSFHGDPADRIIIATTVIHSATLITRDARILDYAKRTKLVIAVTC